MAVTYSVKTVITAIDAGAKAVIGGIRGAFQGLATQVQSFSAGLGKTNTSALGRIGGGVDKLHGKFTGLIGRVTQLVPALGALGSVVGVAGLLMLTQNYASMADALATTATKTGLTVEQLQQFRFAAKLANVEAETFDKGMVKLNRTVADAAAGKNKDAAALFARLGINLRDSKGQIRSVADIMPQLAEAFRKNENPAVRVAMATALFGKAGAELIPLLEQGKKKLFENMEAAKKHGLVTDEQTEAAGELDDAMDHLGAAGMGLANRIAAGLVPTLLPLVKGLTDWIDRNREMIGQAVERKVAAIAAAVETVAAGVKSFMALPVVDAFLKSEQAGKAFDIVMIALGATLAGPLLSAIHLVGKAFLLNPIGLAVAAIAALVYIIYDNWGAIVQWFEDKIAKVKAAFDKGLFEGIKTLLIEFNPVALMTEAMNGLIKYLFGIDLSKEGQKIIDSLVAGIDAKISGIKAAFDQGFLQGVKAVFDEFNPAKWVAVKINELSTYLFGTDLAGAGRKMLQSLIDGIKSLLPDLTAIIQPIKDAVSWADRQWGNVKRGAQAVGDAVTGGPTSGGSPAPSLVQGGGGAPARVDGLVRVAVDFSNMPVGVRTTTEQGGQVAAETIVGKSMQGN